jgi:hypothetical protein
MENEFITYEQALALKELGFDASIDEPCFGYYDEGGNLYTEMVEVLKAPLYQQAFRWFREEHGLNSYIYQRSNITYRGVIHKNMKIAVNYTSDSSNYEEAEQACLDKLIEILKAKKT